MKSVLLFSILAAVAAPAVARAARAADPATAENHEQKAAARALFEEGLAHADAGRWLNAADRFERARAIRNTPEITYNLTTALIHLAQLVRASELLRQVAADPQATHAVRQASRTRLDEVLGRLAYLTVEAPPTAIAGEVYVDGRRFDTARLGVALPMDPAPHVVQLRRGESVLGRRELLLHEGERRTINLASLTAPAPALAQASPAAPIGLRAASFSRAGAPAVVAFTERGRTPGGPGADPTEVGASAAPARSRAWIWAVVGAVALGVTTATVLATRDSPAPPRGNVDTWTLGGP